MQQLILMAAEKARSMTNTELSEEIRRFESGEKKLFATDDHGKRVPLHSLTLSVLKAEQARRQPTLGALSKAHNAILRITARTRINNETQKATLAQQRKPVVTTIRGKLAFHV